MLKNQFKFSQTIQSRWQRVRARAYRWGNVLLLLAMFLGAAALPMIAHQAVATSIVQGVSENLLTNDTHIQSQTEICPGSIGGIYGMRQLLDTHSFIWFITGNPRITFEIRQQIENNENLLSIASVWEIAIKSSLGKLNLGMSLDALVLFLILYPKQP